MVDVTLPPFPLGGVGTGFGAKLTVTPGGVGVANTNATGVFVPEPVYCTVTTYVALDDAPKVGVPDCAPTLMLLNVSVK